MPALRSTPLVLVLALCGAPALRAQAAGSMEQLDARVPRDVARVVRELAEQARGRGLPIEPLVQKAIEGAAKGVPAERVNAALRALAAQLDDAALALQLSARPGAAPDTVVVAAGAFALHAGLSTEQLTELAALSTNGGPALALRVAGTLAALGVPPTDAVGLVAASLEAGRSPAELLALPASVQAEMARGATPAQAAAGLARAAAAQSQRRAGGGPPASRPQPPPRPPRPRP